MVSCTTYNYPGSPTEILFKNGLLNENSLTLTEDRKKLFYTRCIPIRLLIVLIIFSLSYINNKNIQTLLSTAVLLISAYAIIKLSDRTPEKLQCVWWSNNLEILQAGAAFIIACISIYNGISSMKLISILLFFNIIIGLVQNPF